MKKLFALFLALTLVFSYAGALVAQAEFSIVIGASFGLAKEGDKVSVLVLKDGVTYAQFENAAGDVKDLVEYIKTARITNAGCFALELPVSPQTLDNPCFISCNGYRREATVWDFTNEKATVNIREVVPEGDSPQIIFLNGGFTYEDYAAGNSAALALSKEIVPDENGFFEGVFEVDAKAVALGSVYIKSDETVAPIILSETNAVFELHVSADAAPGGNGTKESPFASIEEARLALQSIDHKAKRVHVLIHAGEYAVTNTISFGEKDSGYEHFPVVYKAAGDGEVIFNASTKLDFTDFRSVSDPDVLSRLPQSSREVVKVMSLDGYGIDPAVLSVKDRLASNQAIPGIARLYFNDRAQTIARYPNTGYVTLTKNDVFPTKDSEGNDTFMGKFRYSGIPTDVTRWEDGKDTALMCGYFANDYMMEWVPLGAVNQEEGVIELGRSTVVAANSTSVARFYIQDLPEELDIPGEYFIDAPNKLLYYYPTREFRKGDVLEITSFNKNIVSLSQVSYMTLEGLSFRHSLQNIIKANSCRYLTLSDCEVMDSGEHGIRLQDGKYGLVEKCTVRDIDRNGISVNGGASQSDFSKSKNRFANNHLYNFARIGLMGYKSGLTLAKDGGGDVIGDIVENNLFHGTPRGNAVRYGGNENTIRYNEMFGLMHECADTGIINTGRCLDEFGNLIEYNYIHDYGPNFDAHSSEGVGIYIDDWESGQIIKNNIVIGTQYYPGARTRGNISVGAMNTWQQNVFVGMGEVPFAVGGRATSYFYDRDSEIMQQDSYSSKRGLLNTLYGAAAKLFEVYPAMTTLKNKIDEEMATGEKFRFPIIDNVVTDNLCVDRAGTYKMNIDSTIGEGNTYGGVNRNNHEVFSKDYAFDIFVDPENHDWRLTNEAVSEFGFPSTFVSESNFDMDSIGIQEDVYDIPTPDAQSSPFEIIYPASKQNLLSGEDVFVQWESALYADRYEYFVATDPSFSQGSIVASGVTHDTYAELNVALQDATAYYLKVVAKNFSKQIGNTWENEGGASRFTINIDPNPLSMKNLQILSDGNELYNMNNVSEFEVKMNIKNNKAEETPFIAVIGLYSEKNILKNVNLFRDYISDDTYVISSAIDGAKEGTKVSILVLKDGYTTDDVINGSGDITDIVAYIKTVETDKEGRYTALLPSVSGSSDSLTCVISCKGELTEGTIESFTGETTSLDVSTRTYKVVLKDKAVSTDYIKCFIIKDVKTLRPLTNVVEKIPMRRS